MKLIFPLVLIVASLAGCGPKVVPAAKRPPTERPTGCPSALRMPQEEITVFFSEPLPSRIAIDVDGERRISECTRARSANSVVRFSRLEGNRLGIKVQRMDGKRAEEISFSVTDLKDCKAPEAELMKQERKAVRYATEYPNGTKCAGQDVARIELVR